MPDPYIGVCDFESAQQAAALTKVMRATSEPLSRRRLMVGVMLSYKTMHGIESKWSAVWPTKEDIAAIFAPQPFGLNTLHYADFVGKSTAVDLVRAAGFGGPHLDAVQLDMIWPDPDDLFVFGDARPDLKVVLQVNTKAMEDCYDDPEQIADRLDDYGGAVDYVLLDRSMGRGQGLDAEALLPYLRTLAERKPDLGLAVAGGLGPDTLHLIDPILEEFPGISVDAQSGLHIGGQSLATIDSGRATLYVQRAAQLFRKFGT
ncbi:hypothetical protein ACFL26_00550 [Patescibacteria group bacterium]